MHHQLNVEFIRLLELSGWTQAEAARRLHLDPATISLYVSHKTRPSATVVGFLKSLLGDPTPIPGVEGSALPGIDKKRMLEGWEEELLNGLRALEAERRKRIVRHLQGLVDEMPKPSTEQAGTPSVVHPVVEQILKDSPQLPAALTKVPSSAAGYKELLRRGEQKGRKSAKRSSRGTS